MEASGAWAVTPDFNLRAGVAYTHARYASFPGASVALPAPAVPGGPPVFIDTSATEDLSGRRIARAPDWTANIGADYTIPISVGKVIIAGNGYYTSDYAPFTEAYDKVTGKSLYYNSGYFLANASVDWIRDHYSIGVWVNDIGNTRFAILNQANGFGTYKVFSSPRTYGVRINYAY
jgi:iron complex outermembrane receptor protein